MVNYIDFLAKNILISYAYLCVYMIYFFVSIFVICLCYSSFEICYNSMYKNKILGLILPTIFVILMCSALWLNGRFY